MVKSIEDKDTKNSVKEYKKIIDVNRMIAKYESDLLKIKKSK